MKKIVFILPLIALFVTGCQKNNILKVTLTEAEDCDQFIERYSILYFDKGDANLKLVDSKKMGNKVTLVYNSLITEIGDDAFNGESSLKSVEIPNSVTEIGNLAFACTSLKSIELPDSVTEIGEYAFSRCTSLKSIEIPDSVTEIGDGAFSRCTSLKSIEIPSLVTEIGNCVFEACKSLKSIELPDTVTEIGDGAFYGCTSLKSIEIPDSVTEIGGGAFAECTSLKKVRIPKNTHFDHNSFPEDVEIIEY